jgi:GH18 family chitinase
MIESLRMRALAATLMILLAAGEAAADAPRVVGYYGSWGIYARDYHVAEIPAADLTHLNYAFANVSAAGECALADPWADVQKPYPGDGGGPVRGNFRQLQILKAAHPHLKTLLAMGGWTLSAHFSDAALTPASRQHLAQSCVAMMATYGFDGLDVDWEFPVSGGQAGNTMRPEDRQNFTALLAALRAELDARAVIDGRPYLLTAAVPAPPGLLANFELDQIHAHVDYLQIMAYDMHGPWSPITHFHAPLFAPNDDPPWESDGLSGDAAVTAYLAAGVPSSKIVLGVPFFARAWKQVGGSNAGLFQSHGGVPPGTFEEAGVLDYRDVHANYLPTYSRFWHPQAQAPWLYNPVSQIMIAYDDPQSIAAKSDYVAARNLSGLMFWELGLDSDEHTLVDAIASNLQANCPDSPPACDAPGRSAISLRTGDHPRLSWTFSKGTVARAPGDFGDPTATTTYALCLYNDGQRVSQVKVAPGSGWRSLSSGYAYKAQDGIRRIVVKGGDAGRPRIIVSAVGAAVPAITTPLPEPVSLTIALVPHEAEACVAATFTAATRNVAGSLRARFP